MDILRKAVHTAIVFFWYVLIYSPSTQQSGMPIGSIAHAAASIMIFAIAALLIKRDEMFWLIAWGLIALCAVWHYNTDMHGGLGEVSVIVVTAGYCCIELMVIAAVKGIEAAYTQKKKSSEGESPE